MCIRLRINATLTMIHVIPLIILMRGDLRECKKAGLEIIPVPLFYLLYSR